MVIAIVVIVGLVVFEAVMFCGRIVFKTTGASIRPMVEWRGKKLGIHHGFAGFLLIVAYGMSLLPHTVRLTGCLALGLILLLSDLIHHCLLRAIYGRWDPTEADPKSMKGGASMKHTMAVK